MCGVLMEGVAGLQHCFAFLQNIAGLVLEWRTDLDEGDKKIRNKQNDPFFP